MHSLFWKILISFWVALILFSGLTLWTTSYYLEKVRSESTFTHPRENVNKYTLQAQSIVDSKGLVGLKRWLAALDKREIIPYLLIGPNGLDLLNRKVSLRLQSIIKRRELRKNSHDEHKREHQKRHSRMPPVMVNGVRYRLLPDFQSVTLSRVLNRPRVIAIPFLLAAFISGIVCYLLARYLIYPVKKLRAATRKLAAGDFNERVAHTFGNRKDEIVDLANDFDHMAEQLTALIYSHKQLLRDASHELRSPLARLQVALELARQKNKQGSSNELDRIEREAERLNELIGQLLSLARIEAGQTDKQFEDIRIDELLSTLAEDASYEARADSRDVKIVKSTVATISGNRKLIYSAIENVVRNAIRYTREGTTVELSIEKTLEKAGWITIKIKDFGPGIADDLLERIFEPFVRVSEARERKSGGYGLGLAIASSAINVHGGNIVACNDANGGLGIKINLPVKEK